MRYPRRLAVVLLFAVTTWAQADLSAYTALRWRLLGPFRAGRVTSVAGVPEDPAVYYAAMPNGGIFKTTDGGRVWLPIFDSVPVASVGAVAVAPSQSNIVYAGTGEQGRGHGVYKSSDAGATWTNVGLAETRYIDNLIVDPRNPDLVLVAASGDRQPGPERGVYRTTDGGKTWRKVLFRDNDTSAVDVCFAPDNPRVVFAALQRRQPGPPARGQQPPPGPDAFLYKSTDEGASWQMVGGNGLPRERWGKTGVAVAARTKGRRVFAIVSQGLFRSDDGGANWQRITSDPRVIGSSYFSRVFADPVNPEVVYVAQTTMYRSQDGGKTFAGWYGAPSGDDIHAMWINPRDPRHMILAVDQGAIVSLDAGKTWSSWFNQPTGQFYTVSTDNQFPYYVYAAQQDSGTVATLSRSDYGEITYRDWFSPGGFEVAHILASPLEPLTIYASGWYGTLVRFERRTGQFAHVFVPGQKYRTNVIPPIAFAPKDPSTLYLGAQFVMKSTDRGATWQAISPDLSRGVPKEGQPQPRRGRNYLTALAPSPTDSAVVWTGSGDGLIYITRDGGSTWENVSPSNNIQGLPEPTANSNIEDFFAGTGILVLEASHHNAGTVYAAVQAARDPRPYFYRTRDFGKTWQVITQGLPPESVAWSIRDDPARRGLLYAGTEAGVFVSFDDGDHWQSLQQNLPVSPVRDLAVHGNDLIAATFGRALWVLDDITPLRQLNPAATDAAVHLFHPADAVRARWDVNNDTPLPRETPAGQNPPDGAIVNYLLKSPAQGEITLAIYDAQKNLVRKFSDTPEPAPKEPPNAPDYWFAAMPALTRNAGLNRFAWDLRYPHPPALTYGYFGEHLSYIEYTLPDHAVPGETPRYQPQGPLVVPGQYEIVLTVDGQEYRQPLTVKPDPRVNATQADLEAQLALERMVGSGMAVTFAAWEQVHAARAAFAEKRKTLGANEADAAKALDDKLTALENGTPRQPGFGTLNRDLGRLVTMAGTADGAPSETLRAAAQEQCAAVNEALKRWRDLQADIEKAGLVAAQNIAAAGCQRP